MLADAKARARMPAAAPAPAAARRRRAVEVRILFPSDPLAVRSALGGVLHGLAYLELSPDACGTLELVLAEALNNVVEHAHGGSGDGSIEIRVVHDAAYGASALICELIDDGAPMADGPPGPEAPDAASLPEGGFGWMLIRELARDIDYARLGDRNRLRFHLDVAPEPSAG